MAFSKRVLQLGFNCAAHFHKLPTVHFSSSSLANRFDYRQLSQLAKPNENRAFLVDTLVLVRGLEAKGIPSHQAEAITAAITKVLNDSLETVSHSFVFKAEMQKSEIIQESKLSTFKSEMQKEHQFFLLQREIEKLRSELRRDMDKMRSEFNLGLASVKHDMTKYFIGTLASISAVGIVVLHIIYKI